MATLGWKMPTDDTGNDADAREAAKQLRGEGKTTPRRPDAVERLAARERCEYTVEYDDEEYQCNAVLQSKLAQGGEENICYAHLEQWRDEQDQDD